MTWGIACLLYMKLEIRKVLEAQSLILQPKLSKVKINIAVLLLLFDKASYLSRKYIQQKY